MNAKEKMENFIIATIKNIMRGRDFELDIQSVGKNTLETIMGQSQKREFKMVFDHGKIYVNANGAENVFDDIYSKNFKRLNTIKNHLYEYREKHYYRDDKGNWIKLPPKTGFLGRIFGGKRQNSK